MRHEIYAELGLSPEQLPPVVETDERTGGLRRTSFGWVIEIPAHLKEAEKIAYFLHCVGHYILEHYARRPHTFTDDKIWDAAADYAANALMMRALARTRLDILRAAKAHLYPYRKEFEGLSAEAIYIKLQELQHVWTFGDEHGDFSEGGAPAEKILDIGEVDLRVTGAGTEKANLPIIVRRLLPVCIPAKMQRLFAQTLCYEEQLDILFLPYGKSWTVELPIPKFFVLHCVDVSYSMLHAMHEVLSILWFTIHYIYNFFGGRALQKVVLMDIEKRFEWVGNSPDANLYTKLVSLIGAGGTTYPILLEKELEPNLYDCFILYSDLAIAAGVATERWHHIKKEILPKIGIKILITPENIDTCPPFDVVLRTEDFMRYN